MIAVRKAHPGLSIGSFDFHLPGNRAVLAFWRARADERILVVANLSDAEQTATFDLSRHVNAVPHDLLSGRALPRITEATYSVTLPPYGGAWLMVGRRAANSL
jgi:maltose alpha-D-glucosyltransferase/alpha-amylase